MMMKKQLLFTLAIAGSLFATAQQNARVIPISNKLAHRGYPVPTNNQGGNEFDFATKQKPNELVRTVQSVLAEDVVGGTFYDLQSNRSMGNRIIRHNDGTISAVWTIANTTVGQNYSDRGTGYNYFDGSSWGPAPTTRLESVKTGWPYIGVLASGAEVGVSHEFGTNLRFFKRNTKGTGNWTESQLGYPDAWPRLATGGADGNSIHIIAQSTPTGGALLNGQEALTYYRSQNGGSSWDKQRYVIPATDANNYYGFGADQYAIDAKGNTVAIVAGGYTNDVFLLKSTDNGTNWTKTLIYQYPIAKYNPKKKITDINNDNKADTILGNDGSVEVLIDQNSKIHVWYGRMHTLCNDTAKGLTYFPFTDGLMYWNESMGAQNPTLLFNIQDLDNSGEIELPEDTTHLVMGTYLTGSTSMPSAGIDANGVLYLAYSSVVENTDDGSARAFRHTFLSSSSDGGSTWVTPACDVINDNFTEGVYAHIPKKIGPNGVDLIYQRDFHAGNGVLRDAVNAVVDPDNDGKTFNDIVVLSGLTTSCSSLGITKNNISYHLDIYPNPAAGNFTISLNKAAVKNVTYTITNILGEQVTAFSSSFDNITVHSTDFKNGIYFINAIIDGQRLSKKVIIAN